MSRKVLFASLAAGVGIAALILVQLERKPMYTFGVSDFLKRDVRDERVRVQGSVVPGTLCSTGPDCGYRFAITDRYESLGSTRPILPVSFEGCDMPDNFLEHPQRALDVVVDGQRCQNCHDFQATTVLTRTYGKYEYPSDAEPAPLPLPPPCDALKPRM
jgi:cytochrome c-type biogenesis protein CcmE